MIAGKDIVKLKTQSSHYDEGHVISVYVDMHDEKRPKLHRMSLTELLPLIQRDGVSFNEDPKRKYTHLTLANHA